MMLCNLLETFKAIKDIQVQGGTALPNIFCFHPAHLRTLNKFFILMLRGFSKTIKYMAGPDFPKHGPVQLTMLKKLSVLRLWSRFKKFQVNGWAALPNIAYHGPALFSVLKNLFALMLCRHWKTIKQRLGRVSPNTGQLLSQRWRTFSFGCFAAIWRHLNFGEPRSPTLSVTAQLIFRCWKNSSCRCYEAYKWQSNLRHDRASPNTTQFLSWC